LEEGRILVKKERKEKWKEGIKEAFGELFAEILLSLLCLLVGIGILAVLPGKVPEDFSFEAIYGIGLFGLLAVLLVFGVVFGKRRRSRARLLRCEACKQWPEEEISSFAQYEAALARLRDGLEGGGWELLSCTCPVDKVKREDGSWVADSVFHTVKCKACGTSFTLLMDTRKEKGRFYCIR
jgi:hypothetical protein